MGEGSITLTLFNVLLTCSAGLMAAAALAERANLPVRVLAAAAAAALVCLAAGGAAALANLGRPALIFGVLSNPGTSIFEQFVALMAFAAAILVYLVLLYRGAENAVTFRTACVASLLGLVLVAILGKSLVMPWRAAWNTYTIILGPAAWMALMAASCYALMAWRSEDDPHPVRIAVCAVAALAAAAVYLAALAVSGSPEALGAVNRALSGDAAGLLWLGIVVCGALVPLAAAFFAHRAPAAGGIIALAGALVGCGAGHLLVTALGSRTWEFFG